MKSNRLNLSKSHNAKLEGMALVAQNKETCVLRGLEIIRWLAARKPFLICDDVWSKGFEADGDPRVLGVVFRYAAVIGVIKKTKQYVLTAQVKSHRAPIQVWKSCTYKKGGKEPLRFKENELFSRTRSKPAKKRAAKKRTVR